MKNTFTWNSEYFYGNRISEYGLKNGYVDYGTLSKAFDMVLNNYIMNETMEMYEWEKVSGFNDNTEEIEELEEKVQSLCDEVYELKETDPDNENIKSLENEIDELNEEIISLHDDEYYEPDIYQTYIVSNSGAEILKEFNEIVYYCDALNMYIWCVTHYGTSWNYVLTNIKLEIPENENNE